jgi:predicted transcriptional regulator
MPRIQPKSAYTVRVADDLRPRLEALHELEKAKSPFLAGMKLSDFVNGILRQYCEREEGQHSR